MSSPFGGHPTLGQYIAWARSQGCNVQSGYATTVDGHVEPLTKISAPPNGKRWVIEVGTGQNEYLTPTRVAQLDRRLGLKSPWFSIDDSGYQPT
jgi:hypothetical protein